MGTYTDKVSRYFVFTPQELRNIVVTILLIGFMYGFNDNQAEFNLAYYSYNMIVSIAITALIVFVFVTGQRLSALSGGYRVEFQMWWPGIIVALIITFISRGYIWIPIAGGMVIHHMAGHRLGFFRYGLNMLDNGVIAVMGPVSVMAFATVLKQLTLWFSIFPNVEFVNRIYWFALIFALVNMLPIPPLAGSKLLFHNRLPYVFILAFMVVYTILAALGFFSWILALVAAFILWILYYLKYDQA